MRRNAVDVFEGTIRNGQIILDVPAALPDGTRVGITPIGEATATIGMREQDWPVTGKEIDAHLARMEQVEPGWLAPEDDVAWRAALQAERDAEKTQFSEGAEKLQRMWQ